MTKFKLTKGRKRELALAEYFAPSKWETTKSNLVYLGLVNTVESADGLSPEECFFLHSERGIIPARVTDLDRLAYLMFGHRRIALNVALWKDGFSDYCLFPSDFDDMDNMYAYELAKSVYLNVWKNER